MIKREFLLKIIDSIEEEFDRILKKGFDKDSLFYDYIEDLKTVVNSLNE